MIDFRFLDEGLGGAQKKKRDREEEDEEAMETEGGDYRGSKRMAVAMEEDSNKPVVGKATYDGVMAGKVSGRKWKAPKTARASAMKVKGGKKLSLEEKERERQVKKAYKARMGELKEEIRTSKVEKRKAAVERKKRKAENELKSGLKLQMITNPKKLKNMSKKQKKQLKVISS